MVFGIGNINAPVMFIGEGPGEKEDLSGEPFVGPAGILLDKYLDYIDLDRSKVYIANIIKCRPPKNRDPLPAEQDACIDYLRWQVKLIKPQIIVCLGRIAAMRIISPDFHITKDHGVWYRKGSFYLFSTYHPSALLRDVAKKPDALEDFNKLQQKIIELGLFS
jgi:DNA polymerase